MARPWARRARELEEEHGHWADFAAWEEWWRGKGDHYEVALEEMDVHAQALVYARCFELAEPAKRMDIMLEAESREPMSMEGDGYRCALLECASRHVEECPKHPATERAIEAEAQAAALREALILAQRCDGQHVAYAACPCCKAWDDEPTDEPSHFDGCDVAAALASDAGARVIARLRAGEACERALRLHHEWCEEQGHGIDYINSRREEATRDALAALDEARKGGA